MTTARDYDAKLMAALKKLIEAADGAAGIHAATVAWAKEATEYLISLRRAVMEPSR